MKYLLATVAGAFVVSAAALTLPPIAAGAARPPVKRSARHQTVPSPKAPAEQKRTVFGSYTLAGYQKVIGALTGAHVTVTGPNTTVEAVIKSSGTRVEAHADEIEITDYGKPNEHAEMHGHFRYSMIQQSSAGPRSIAGTAGHAAFKKEASRIDLTGGVDCLLKEPALEGPGTLHAGSVAVDIRDTPYKYTLSGASASNDIRFTPAPPPKGAGGTQLGATHLSHWESGVFQAGKLARFDGAQVIADLSIRRGGQSAQLKARHIEEDFTDTGQIARARAAEDVHYRFERRVVRKPADPSGKPQEGREEVSGTCAEALYEPESSRFTLDRDVDATLVNTLALAAPAKLLATRVVLTEPAVGDTKTPTRLEVAGGPNRRKLTFTPMPTPVRQAAAPAAAAPDGAAAPAAFVLGTIVVTGFQKAVLEVGKGFEVSSDGAQQLLVDTSDAKSQSSSHLETHRFSAVLADGGGIASAETAGPVTFHIEQPGSFPTPAPGAQSARKIRRPSGQMQVLNGSAAQGLYAAGPQGRILTLKGPLNAKVTDPARFAAPGVLTGETGDTFTLNLATQEFTFDTPNQTGSFVFTARPAEPDPTKPAPAPRSKRKQ